jgi:CheY-like chemotaxis protein
VINEGQGIAETNFSKVFAKGEQIEPQVQQGKRGNGIGLYYCKKQLESTGAEIDVASIVEEKDEYGNIVGNGKSIFTVNLPIAKESLPSSVMTSEVFRLDSSNEVSTLPSCFQLLQDSHQPNQENHHTMQRIAVIQIKKFIRDNDNRLPIIDVFLIDYKMPIMNGVKTIEELQKIYAPNQLLIYGISGDTDYAKLLEDAGANECFPKNDIRSKLTNFLEMTGSH